MWKQRWTFCQGGLLDEANKVFVKMEASICLPNATYNTVVHGCFHNKYSEAIVLVEAMCAQGSADAF